MYSVLISLDMRACMLAGVHDNYCNGITLFAQTSYSIDVVTFFRCAFGRNDLNVWFTLMGGC